jgi:hypothetical protein
MVEEYHPPYSKLQPKRIKDRYTISVLNNAFPIISIIQNTDLTYRAKPRPKPKKVRKLKKGQKNICAPSTKENIEYKKKKIKLFTQKTKEQHFKKHMHLLEELANIVKKKDLRLVLVELPRAEGLTKNFPENYRNFDNTMNRFREEHSEIPYITMTETPVSDDLFCDYVHLVHPGKAIFHGAFTRELQKVLGR